MNDKQSYKQGTRQMDRRQRMKKKKKKKAKESKRALESKSIVGESESLIQISRQWRSWFSYGFYYTVFTKR